MSHVKQLITDYYSNVWSRDIQTVPKLRSYILFKHTFKCEQYVVTNLKKNERSILCQFRCGILPIIIETGRYIGETPEQRLCRFCNTQSVEDEKHFLLHCGLYNNIREIVFQDILHTDIFINFSSDEKLIYLLQTYPRKTAKYLVKAYLKRRNVIY